jgi:S-adenosylmethionine decarboxylase proenzyme
MNTMSSGLPVGVHLLINVYDVPQPELLTYLTRGRPIMEELIRELDLHVVAQTGHQFSPIGYTYAYVLSESHFTIHTYPEYRSCYMDLFCCNPQFDPVHAIERIKQKFQTEHVRSQIIRR